MPRPGAATGAALTAQARVIFNGNPPIDTPTLTQLLDAAAPATALSVARLTPGGDDYQVRWAAADDAGGSGVRGVTVYVARDGGDYEIWRNQTAETSEVYAGEAGHSYRILALATDAAGNREAPPAGVTAPDDGASADLGALPPVAGTTPADPPEERPMPPTTTANPLYVEALRGVPTAPPATRPPEFRAVLRPFQGGAFATGIPESHGGLGPVAVAVAPDKTVLVSGGPGRNQLYHLPAEGGAAGEPIATLPAPIFDLSFGPTGRLWAATGGGPLLELDPATGAVLGSHGDRLTQALAVDPATGRVFVSSGSGVEEFDPAAGTFRHFSDLRVGSLAFSPAGELWAALWPVRAGDIVRFDRQGHAERVLRFDTTVVGIAFGAAGTALEGLLFVSHDQAAGPGLGSELTAVDLITRGAVAVATGGSRGMAVRATPDGRVLLGQTHQVDVLGRVAAPRVVAATRRPAVSPPCRWAA